MRKLINKILGNARHHLSKNKSTNFYRQFIKEGDLCFDVGANVGNRTSVFLSLGAKVVAIEPQQECFRKLAGLYLNNKNVLLENCALAEEKGEAQISVCEDAPTISTMSEEWKNIGRFSTNYKWEKRERVRVSTLDDLIEKYGTPKFCKIDVEGLELPVIKGLHFPIPYLSFEFTKEFLKNVNTCIALLDKIGEYSYNYSTGESMSLNLTEWTPSDKLLQLLESNSSQDFWGDIYARLNKKS